MSLRRAISTALALATLATLAPSGPVAATTDDVAGSLGAWREVRDEVVRLEDREDALEARVVAIEGEIQTRRGRLTAAVDAHDALNREVGRQAVDIYIRHPYDLTDAGEHTSQLLLDQQAEDLAEAAARRDSAALGVEQAVDRLAGVREELDEVAGELSQRRESLAERDREVRTAMGGSPSVDVPTLDALVETQAWLEATYPECALPAAILGGMGLAASGAGGALPASASGRLPFAPVGPAVSGGLSRTGATHAHPLTWLWGEAALGRPLDPRSLRDAFQVSAGWLCETQPGPLNRFSSLSAGLWQWSGDPVWVERALASGRRLGGPRLGLGSVPYRPSGGGLEVAAEERLPDGDIGAMLGWAWERLGTPYSQCIGRPQDPVCPPGTSRFGAGFFDCSGFVAAAYARIGIAVPLTTYAMEANAEFMATKVADRPNPASLLPGDVLLMDGHVALWWGDGKIIHSSAGGLQIEPLPGYMTRDVFAVLRPVP